MGYETALRYFDNSRLNSNLPYVIYDTERDNKIIAIVADAVTRNTVLQHVEGLENDEFNADDFLESSQCTIVNNRVVITNRVAPKGWAHID